MFAGRNKGFLQISSLDSGQWNMAIESSPFLDDFPWKNAYSRISQLRHVGLLEDNNPTTAHNIAYIYLSMDCSYPD